MKQMILSFTSSKGGVGKSTSCAAIACALASQGEPVQIIDLDTNQTLARWAKHHPREGVTVRHCRQDQFAEAFDAAAATGEHVLVDLAGFLHVDLLRAFSRADLVIIPATPSEPDVHEAMRMAHHVRGVAGSVDRDIPYRVLLTQVLTLRTRVGDFVGSQIDQQGLPRFSRGMVSRTAYKEMFLTGEAPTDGPTGAGAGAEVLAILEEVRQIVGGKSKRKLAGAA